MAETNGPPVRTILHRVLIPCEEFQSSRLGYEGALMAYHINPFIAYDCIERPELGAIQIFQLRPQVLAHG